MELRISRYVRYIAYYNKGFYSECLLHCTFNRQLTSSSSARLRQVGRRPMLGYAVEQRDRQTNAGDYIIPRESFRGDNKSVSLN